MKKLFLISLLSLIFSSNLFAQDLNSDDAINFVQGKLIVKFKPQYQVSQSINNEINSEVNYTKFGINSIDNILSDFKVRDIEQKFPYHNDPEFRAQIYKKAGTQVKTLENIYQIDFDNKMPVMILVKELNRLPEVEYAEPVYINKMYDVPDDEKYSVMQHLPQIMASEAWDIAKGEDGEEVVVGICDSGVEWTHPDLLNNLKQNLGEDLDGDGVVIVYNEAEQKWEFDPDDVNGIDDDGNGYADDFIGWNFSDYVDGTPVNAPAASTLNTHGTHVTGLAAGVTNNEIGIASISWNVKYLPTKHGNNNGGTSIYAGYEGIVYLAENGADIINMSWGGGSYGYYEQDMIYYANSLGSILVAAAGNNNDMEPHYPSSYSGVVSVASVASTDARAYYSTYGPTVDISAPGGDRYVDGGVWSTIPGNSYAKYQGTSMASPVAAGLFALVKSYFPEKTNEEIIAQIVGTCDDIYDLNPDYQNYLGTGRINALSALTEEPVIQEGLKLSIMHTILFTYDPELDEYYDSSMFKKNSEGYLHIMLKNSNNMYGQDLMVVNAVSDNPDVTILTQNFVAPIGPDETIKLEIPFEVSEDAETGTVNITLNFYDPVNDIIYGNEATLGLILNDGGILVWEPVPNGQDMSGTFIKDFYENMGVSVFYSNDILPTFDGFDAIFVSFGSTSAPDYDSYYDKLYSSILNLIYYSYHTGADAKIYFESQNFLTHYNPNILGGLLGGLHFGIDGFNYDRDVTTDLIDIAGVPENNMFNDFLFSSSSQENTYEMDRLIPSESSEPMLYMEDFGYVTVLGTNYFGSQVITSTIALSELDDETCPNTRQNLMRRINVIFELYAEPEITLTDVETCVGTPVTIGGNEISCDPDYPIVDFVKGGSGYVTWKWSPSFGLDDEYAANPTVLDPQINKTYTLELYDLFYGKFMTKDIKVTVNSGAVAKVPLFKMYPSGTPINLNDQIISVTGGAEPYQEYIWTDMYGETVDPENEIPNIGLNRYYLTVVDANGCESKPARMIVYVSMYKQLAENDVVAGQNGTSVLAAYPNPTVDNINIISVFENNVNATVKIIDLNGNTVYTMNKTSINELNETINVSNLATGTYFIIVDSEEDTVMKKFIKQ